jgi:hypothetical protein
MMASMILMMMAVMAADADAVFGGCNAAAAWAVVVVVAAHLTMIAAAAAAAAAAGKRRVSWHRMCGGYAGRRYSDESVAVMIHRWTWHDTLVMMVTDMMMRRREWIK